jgi:FMN-dependent NADH-azoreductase
MKNILHVISSVKGGASRSSLLSRELVERLVEQQPDARVTTRDVAASPVALIDADALAALSTPAEQRSPAQRTLVASHDQLIAEIQAADIVVLGVPMYNFAIPVQLKAYLDAIARAGVTFRYASSGPEGLLRGKRVYVVLARGGVYRDSANDSQKPYLGTMLGFLGMTDVEFVHAEGLEMGAAGEAAGLAAARRAIADLLGDPALRSVA